MDLIVTTSQIESNVFIAHDPSDFEGFDYVILVSSQTMVFMASTERAMLDDIGQKTETGVLHIM